MNIFQTTVYSYINSYIHTHTHSARNKDQKLVGRFFADRIFYWLLIAVPLKMYRKYGQLKWILIGQMLKLVRKWPIADCYF